MSLGIFTKLAPAETPARPIPLSSIWLSSRLAIGLIVTVFATIYVGSFVYRGWLPHDEGLLAQMAERVLRGELPHVHFDETYTGGLTFVHGLAFYFGGVKLSVLRLSLAVWIPPFVFAFYWLLSRHGTPYLAALATGCGVVWSVPNYFAALPSWHNLFLWLFGLVCLHRFIDTHQRRWLFWAGMCGGVAIIFKITGLYFVAATLLFLAFRQTLLSRKQHSRDDSPRSVVYSLFISAISLAVLGLVWFLIRSQLAPMEFLLFVIPTSTVAFFLVSHEWQTGRGPFSQRFRALTADVLTFGVGLLPPILIFLVPYLLHGGLAELLHGVFIQPQLRMSYGQSAMAPLTSVIPTLIPVGLLLIWGEWGQLRWTRQQQWAGTGMMLLGAALFLAPQPADVFFYWNCYSLRNLAPFLVIFSCTFLLGRQATKLSNVQRQSLYLFAVSASFCQLIQFPFGALIYFCYTAPVALLCLHALLIQRQTYPRELAWAMLSAVFLIGLLVNNHYGLVFVNWTSQFDHELNLSRAGLVVQKPHKEQYEDIVQLVTKYAPEDSPILATPDCPEIYFLANRKNPTRHMYDFFSDDDQYYERLIELIDQLSIPVVVVNLQPNFSPQISERLGEALQERFTFRQQIGNMVVCYRAEGVQQPVAMGTEAYQFATTPVATAGLGSLSANLAETANRR